MHRLHNYPDVQVMFRRLIIATLVGIFAALAVALFRHSMVALETLFLGNDSGSLVNAAQSMPWWRRLLTPALGGITAGTLLWLWQRRRLASARPDRLHGSAGNRRWLFRYAGKPRQIAGIAAGGRDRQRHWPKGP